MGNHGNCIHQNKQPVQVDELPQFPAGTSHRGKWPTVFLWDLSIQFKLKYGEKPSEQGKNQQQAQTKGTPTQI